jgi:GNAT superfamily N-acetyltransferase
VTGDGCAFRSNRVGGTVPRMIETRPMADAECRAAGALLAARHADERQRFPMLPAVWEVPARAEEVVRDTVAWCESVAAVDERGELLGFLTSFESAPDPSSPMARYVPARAALHLVHGHAVARDAEPGPIYRILFAELAAGALDRGVIDFVVHVPIGGPAIEAAWVALGFGRASIVAVRDVAPIGRELPPDVAVRLATPDELDVVDQLVDEEVMFHAASPVFVPYVRAATRDAVRAELAERLASDDHGYLIASRRGRDVGVISVGPGFGSPLYVPDGAAYIAATAVVPDARGTGVGGALVEAAFTWARERGHRAACLHFHPANPTSSAFWPGVGFVQVMAHMRRRLDERILTSRPPGQC